MKPTLHAYIRLMRLDKPVGVELLLWPTLIALWLASHGKPTLGFVVCFALGALFMRSAGCVINDIADQDFDKQVRRTYLRPLAAGELTTRQALRCFVVLVALSASLLLFLPFQVFIWSFAALGLATLYPFMKRITYLPQVILGAAFSWAIPMAFIAETGSTPLLCWLLYVANLLWTVAYDTLYAMTDREDDINAGVKSTARLFGALDLHIVTTLTLCAMALMEYIFYQTHLTIAMYTTPLITLLALYFIYCAKSRQPTHTLQAFQRNVWIGRLLFVVTVLSFLLPTG